MSENNQNMVNIGGLWVNKSKNGEFYFSGYMNGAKLLIFKNQFKEKDSQPDYVMYVTKADKQAEKTSANEFESTIADNGDNPNPPPSDNEAMKDIPF